MLEKSCLARSRIGMGFVRDIHVYMSNFHNHALSISAGRFTQTPSAEHKHTDFPEVARASGIQPE